MKPKVSVDAGDTVEVTVVAEVGCAAIDSDCTGSIVNNQEFAVALIEVNGETVNSVAGNLFEVGGVNAAKVEVTMDGTSDTVQLGDEGVELETFDLDNKSEYDVTITSVTLEDRNGEMDSAAENFVLEFDGDVVATVDEVDGDFLTFMFDTPLMIEDGQSKEFVVYADIIGGVGETISLILDETHYVL